MTAEKKKAARATEKKKAAPRKKKVAAAEPVIEAAEPVQAEILQTAAPSAKVSRPRVKKAAFFTGNKFYGTGRRKEAVAKVWVGQGSGRIMVNGRDFHEYFCSRKLLEFQVLRPLVVAGGQNMFDVQASVFGGGIPGQAGALVLGIARGLLAMNPEIKVKLKREGLLTRDPRMKERKKYGLKRARRAFQYTKR
jgi:small subunit ribosomal protein S9